MTEPELADIVPSGEAAPHDDPAAADVLPAERPVWAFLALHAAS